MTQDGIRTARQDCGHPNALLRDPPPPKRVDTAIHRVQPLRLHTTVDRAAPKSELDQLIPSHHPVLSIGELDDCSLTPTATLFSYS